MTRDQLIRQYAAAIRRDQDAREEEAAARTKACAAEKALWEARKALREYEDEEVTTALKLVA